MAGSGPSGMLRVSSLVSSNSSADSFRKKSYCHQVESRGTNEPSVGAEGEWRGGNGGASGGGSIGGMSLRP